MLLSQDFKEFVKLLNQNKVKYLIVGGYALAYHGYPRYTQDIDFWILTNLENANNLLKVLKEFGFSSLNISKEDLTTQGNIIQLGYPPNRIDILTEIDGVAFEEAYPSRVEVELEGEKMYLINLDYLMQNKAASGRLQDKADLEQLEKIKKKKKDQR